MYLSTHIKIRALLLKYSQASLDHEKLFPEVLILYLQSACLQLFIGDLFLILRHIVSCVKTKFCLKTIKSSYFKIATFPSTNSQKAMPVCHSTI